MVCPNISEMKELLIYKTGMNLIAFRLNKSSQIQDSPNCMSPSVETEEMGRPIYNDNQCDVTYRWDISSEVIRETSGVIEHLII